MGTPNSLYKSTRRPTVCANIVVDRNLYNIGNFLCVAKMTWYIKDCRTEKEYGTHNTTFTGWTQYQNANTK